MTNNAPDTNRPNGGGGPVDIPPEILDKDFWKMVVRYQFAYSMVGLGFALICLVCGMILFLHGISPDSSHWSADIFGFKVNDAAPGIVLFLVGVAVAQFTRFDVSIKRLTSKKTGILSWFKGNQNQNGNR